MPLQATIEAAEFDTLPDESVLGKDLFTKNEKENKYELKFPEYWAAQESTRKLADNNKELLKQKGEANAKLAEFEKLGKTAEEIEEQLKAKRSEGEAAMIAKHQQELEAIKKSAGEETAKEKAAREAADRRYADTLLDVTVERLIRDHKMTSAACFALKHAIRVERDEATGEFVTRVYENGQPAFHGSEPMKPDQIPGKWRESKTYPELFVAGTEGGSGANPRQNGGNNGSKQYEGLSPTEKLNLARAQGVRTP